MNVAESTLDRVSFVTRHWPVKKAIDRIEAVTREHGPSEGCRMILSSRKLTVLEQWDQKEKTLDVQADKTKPAIVVFNHPHDLEGFIAQSVLPAKSNFSSVSMSGMERNFGNEFAQHIIPVYHRPKKETPEEKYARQNKNLEALQKATEKMNSGENILIAPDGGSDNKWKNGTAILFENASKMDEAYFIMTHVPDTKKTDIVKLLFKMPQSKTIRISEPINVHDLPIPQAVREKPSHEKDKLVTMSAILQEYYENWTHS